MLYAHPGRVRRSQIIGDAVLLAWCLLWALVGRAVFRLVNTLRAPAEQLNSAADGLSSRVANLDKDLPGFLQGRLGLGNVSGSADSLGDAATNQADTVTHVASVLGWTTALVPIVLAVAVAVFVRVRWFRRVRSSLRFAHTADFEELLARRAVMHQPLRALARVSADPLLDLREGHFAALARLELSDLGINPRRRALKSTKSV